MGLFSSIGGLFSGNSAANGYNNRLDELAQQNQYSPYNVYGPLGQSNFDQPGNAVSMLSPELKHSFDNFGALTTNLGYQAKGFDPRSFQNEYFDAIDALESRREASAFNGFESKVFNNAGVHTGSANMVNDFARDLGDARYARSQKAVLASQDYFTNMLNQLLGLEQGRLAIGTAALDPLEAGANFGQIAGSQNLDAAKLSAEGAGVKFGAKANTGSAIGGIIDDGISAYYTGGLSELGSSFFG